MKYDRAEALRYFEAQVGDKEAEVLLDTVYLQLRNEVRAKNVYQLFDCIVDATGVTLANGVRFNSSDLGRHLKDCQQVIVLAATLGSAVDIALRRLALKNVAEAAAAQAICAALIEAYCDEIEQEIVQSLAKTYLRPRFSPGYGNWSLAEQTVLLTLLTADKKIGLTLTDGLMLAPTKSVTAVIGLSEKICQYNKCANCMKQDCAYRRG